MNVIRTHFLKSNLHAIEYEAMRRQQATKMADRIVERTDELSRLLFCRFELSLYS